MVGGATLTKLIGTSAWYAPGAAGAALVEAIVRDEKKLFTCCVSLDGEYGQKDICLGVPVVIGKNGWEKIVDFKLNDEEQLLLEMTEEITLIHKHGLSDRLYEKAIGLWGEKRTAQVMMAIININAFNRIGSLPPGSFVADNPSQSHFAVSD